MSVGGRPSEGWLTVESLAHARRPDPDGTMAPMTEPTEPTAAEEPAGSPGEAAPGSTRRRLDRPPADRFGQGRDEATDNGSTLDGASPSRAIAMGIVGAAIGTTIYLVLAIVFSFTAGLIVVAIFTGRFIGLFVRAGAAGTLSSPARVTVSVVIFLVAMSIAIVGTWLAAGMEGGVLPLGEYLDDAYGTPLISLEYMLGTLMAWWSSR